MTSAYATLHQPFLAGWIDNWEGAVAPEQRDASLWLYEAVVSDQPNLVRGMIRTGARVNTRLKDDAIHPSLGSCSPLTLALWMLSHDRLDKRRGARDGSGHLQKDTGVIQVLLDAGALPPSTLNSYLNGPDWEDAPHPVFTALETANFERILAADGIGVLTHRDYERGETNGWTYYRNSVVPDHEAHNPHLWLHRAVRHHRWDVVKAWFAQDGVLGVPEGDSAVALLWEQILQASCLPHLTGAQAVRGVPSGKPRRARTSGSESSETVRPQPPSTSPRALRQELARLRSVLLKTDDTVYRQEVLLTLGMALRPDARRADPAVVAEGLAWVDALLAQRALTHYALDPGEWAGFRSMPDSTETAVQHYLIAAEGRAIRAVLPKPSRSTPAGEDATSPRSPLRRRL